MQKFKKGDRVNVDGDLATGTGWVLGLEQIVRVRLNPSYPGDRPRVIRYNAKDLAAGKLTLIKAKKKTAVKKKTVKAKTTAKKKGAAKARKR
jgi:hypothetical protein